VGTPTQSGVPPLLTLPNEQDGAGLLVESELRFPIKLKGRTMWLGEVSYQRQSMDKYVPYSESESDDISLKQATLALCMVHQVNEEWTLLGHFGLRNGSTRLLRFNDRSRNISTVQLLQRTTEKGKIGWGFRVGYHQRLSFLPLFLFERPLNEKWTLEMLLPAKITAVKTMRPDTRLILGFRGSTFNAQLEETFIGGGTGLNFRHITANAMGRLEHQFTSLLGLSLEMGVSMPISQGIYDLDDHWIKAVDLGPNIVPYARLGVFCSVWK
jgi:hypothetical protein